MERKLTELEKQLKELAPQEMPWCPVCEQHIWCEHTYYEDDQPQDYYETGSQSYPIDEFTRTLLDEEE